MQERKVEQRPRRTGAGRDTGGECKELTPVLPALALAPPSATPPPAPALAPPSKAWSTEQKPGLQKSRREETRCHQATGHSAEGDSPAKNKY